MLLTGSCRSCKPTCFQHEAEHNLVVCQEACAQQQVQSSHCIQQCKQRSILHSSGKLRAACMFWCPP